MFSFLNSKNRKVFKYGCVTSLMDVALEILANGGFGTPEIIGEEIVLKRDWPKETLCFYGSGRQGYYGKVISFDKFLEGNNFQKRENQNPDDYICLELLNIPEANAGEEAIPKYVNPLKLTKIESIEKLTLRKVVNVEKELNHRENMLKKYEGIASEKEKIYLERTAQKAYHNAKLELKHQINLRNFLIGLNKSGS